MTQRLTFTLGILTGLLAPATLSSAISRAEPDAVAPSVQIDESKVQTSYANAYRIHTSAEEAIIDLGLNMPNLNPDAKPGSPVFTISNRVFLSYKNTKRLSISLSNLVKRYEEQFGPIDAAQK